MALWLASVFKASESTESLRKTPILFRYRPSLAELRVASPERRLSGSLVPRFHI
jgi:hypothetical protein